MNFVAQMEEHLRDLGTEARKKHPGVKEASERAILQLRTLQNSYVAAVRRATKGRSHAHPTTALFQSQDLLRPFLLAANYPDVSFGVLTIVLDALQLLLQQDAILSDDAIHLVRVLAIQSNVCAATLSAANNGGGILMSGSSGIGTAATSASSSVASSTASSSGGAVASTLSGISHAAGSLGGLVFGLVGAGGAAGGGGSGGSGEEAYYSSSTGGTGQFSNRSLKENSLLASRILQTVALVVQSPGFCLSEELLSQCLAICLVLVGGGGGGGGAVGKVQRAAVGTFKLIVLTVFARAEQDEAPQPKPPTSAGDTQHYEEGEAENDQHPTNANTTERDGEEEQASPADAAPSGEEDDKQSSPSLSMVARGLLSDLCELASVHPKIHSLRGPFALPLGGGAGGGMGGLGAGHRVEPPPASACFQLLQHLVLKGVLMQPETQEVASLVITTLNEELSAVEESSSCSMVAPPAPTTSPRWRDRATSSTLAGTTESIRDLAVFCHAVELAQTILSLPGAWLEESQQMLLLSLTRFVTLGASTYRDLGFEEDEYVYTPRDAAAMMASKQSDKVGEGGASSSLPKGTLLGTRSSSSATASNATAAAPTAVHNPLAPQQQRGGGGGGTLHLRLLWRALLCLESLNLYFHSPSFSRVLLDKSVKSVLAVVSEAMSDFATIGGSCRWRMLQFVASSQTFGASWIMTPPVAYRPVFFQRAGAALKALDVWEAQEDTTTLTANNSSSKGASTSLEDAQNDMVGDAGVLVSYESGGGGDPHASLLSCTEGDAVGVAYRGILLLSHFVLEYCGTSTDKSVVLLETCFVPCVTVLQHFLKRFPGSLQVVVPSSLEGYLRWSNVAIPLFAPQTSQQRTLISSLCQLSLPRSGGSASSGNNHSGGDANRNVEEHHIEVLSVLFRVVHCNCECLMEEEWQIVLETLSHLAAFSVTSSGSTATATATAIAKSVTRIPSFTNGLSSQSFQAFVMALVRVSTMASSTSSSSTLSPGKSNAASNNQSGNANRRDSLDSATSSTSSSRTRGRLLGRATNRSKGGGGASGANSSSASATSTTNSAGLSTSSSGDDGDLGGAAQPPGVGGGPPFVFQKSFAQLFYEHAYEDVAPGTGLSKDDFMALPFALVALLAVTRANKYRIGLFYDQMATHLCSLACQTESTPARVSLFAVHVLANVVTSLLEGDDSEQGKERIHYTVWKDPESPSDCFRVEGSIQDRREETPEDDSLTSEVVQEDVMAPLARVVMETDKAEVALTAITLLEDILESCGDKITGKTWVLVVEAVASLADSDNRRFFLHECHAMAFRCLKLIVDDFLQLFPSSAEPHGRQAREALVACCTAFGQSTHDVNTSFTATGLLWTIADRYRDLQTLEHVLTKLAFLAADRRAEVRNCSVNTLFSCIVGLGHRFTAEPAWWKSCMNETVFGVLDNIEREKCGGAEGKSDTEAKPQSQTASRYKVTVHHSRDSASKQWISTEVLMLKGFDRVLRQYFTELLRSEDFSEEVQEEPWLETAWTRVVTTALSCASQEGGREYLDLRIAAAELLLLCTQVACRAGLSAAGTQARVGTNMEVVNGALRSVRVASSNRRGAEHPEGEATVAASTTSSAPKNSAEMEVCRSRLFQVAFDALEQFVSQIMEEDDEGRKRVTESAGGQVVTRFAQGLDRVYECCKDDEMLPQAKSRRLDNILSSRSPSLDPNVEVRFVDLVLLLAQSTGGTSSSTRYLSQPQRISLDLLTSMAKKSSLVAFEQVATLGGRYFFVGGKQEGVQLAPGELLQYEAAKASAEVFESEQVPDDAKVAVLVVIMEHWKEDSATIVQKGFHLNFLVPAMKQGTEASSRLSKNSGSVVRMLTPDKVSAVVEVLWKAIVAGLDTLLSVWSSSPRATDVTVSLVEILSCAVLHVPPQTSFESNLGGVLSQGASRAASAARQAAVVADESWSEEVQIFRACFQGLVECQPQGGDLRKLAEQLLSDATSNHKDDTADEEDKAKGKRETSGSDAKDKSRKETTAISKFTESEPTPDDGKTSINSDVEEELAMIVCETLTSLEDLSAFAIALYPLLCRLTRLDNSSLREEVSAVLESIEVDRVVQQAKEAQERAAAAELALGRSEAQVEELQDAVEELKRQLSIFADSSTLLT